MEKCLILLHLAKRMGLKQPEINQLFGTLGKARNAFTTLISTATKLGGDMSNVTPLKSILGQRVKDYLGGTYRVFEDKPILPFVRYTPTNEAYKNARDLFVRYAAKAGKPFESVNQVDEQLNRLVDTALAAKKPNELPFLHYNHICGRFLRLRPFPPRRPTSPTQSPYSACIVPVGTEPV